ncbi:MAG TPA: SDR family NAD(P)-dependent oxidoreductase [archaeon]|nr:SDR family NAD(P)-dependent oxidoreductase [archaeon]
MAGVKQAGKKIAETALVTGGCGFIGSHLVEKLAEKGFKVKIIDSLIKGRLSSIQYLIDNGKAEFIEGDIRERDAVDSAMKGCDYVFHTAGVHIQRSCASPEEAIDVNVRGSYNVFKSALDNNVKRVIFSSSSSVYGDPEKLPMSEESELKIVEPYGASKLMSEHLLRFLSKKGLNFNILRYFNVYGERQAAHAYYTTVIIHFIKNLLKNQPPVIDGRGDQSMDFTHVSDVVNANLLAMQSAHCNDVFNVGTGTATSVKELAEILAEAVGKNVKPIFKEREVLVTKRQADTRKAEKILGFRAKVNVRDGLFEVARAIAAHPELYV